LCKTARGFEPADANITTRDEVSSITVKNYHRQMIHLSLEALEREPAARRDISSVTIPVKRADIPKLKERLQLLRKELLNLAAGHGEAEDVVQLNFQLFALASGD